MKQYQFTVTSQCIEAPKCAAFVSGSAEIYEAVFEFDASWDGFARTAVFECSGERREQLLVNDRCIVPLEILHAFAYLRVGVYGVDGNKTMPTVYSGKMFVARGAEPSEAAREHSADMFDQIVEIGQQAAQDAESAADSASAASTSATNAAGSATTAQASAEQAAETAQSVEEFAIRAETAAENAESSATQATSAASTATTAANSASTSATSAAGSAESAASSSAAASQSAESAATSAQASAASASAAKTSKESAEQFADDASQSATSAQASATTASNQASAAAQSATDADTAKSGAQSAQNAAATSASNAATSAQNAANSASDAAQSATDAATSENNASTSAQTACGYATSASSSATNAANAQTNAEAAATRAETAASNQPIIGNNGNWWVYNASLGEYQDTGYPSRGATGATGPQGETGKPFSVAKVYSSRAAMEADFDNPDIEFGEFVVISSNVQDPDNATLWIKNTTEWKFITDMSGAQGIKGDKGDKGEPGGGGGQPAVEIDISDSITMDETCLWTTLLNLSYDSAAAMKIKQAALAGNAKVTVKIKVSSSSEPKRVTLRMVGSQYTDVELGERYNLTGTAVLLGIAPIDVMLGAYGGDPPTHVLGGLAPQQGNKPLAEFDLSGKITLSRDNLFLSSSSLGNDKSVGEKIKQAALERRANVTFMLNLGDGDPEKVTLPMLGTQSALNDGTPAYSLTGTYVLAGILPMDIMIGTIIYETDCTIVKRIDSAGDKPIYDPVDKPDTTPDGAFLRWSSEQKKWVAETVPAAEGGSF